MQLSQQQIDLYNENGFLFLPELFTSAEIAGIKAEFPSIFAQDGPQRIFEKDGTTIRSIYGAHTENELMRRLVRSPRLLNTAQQIIGTELYVHQFKINRKMAFVGDVWEWHQDYIFWLKEDGIVRPDFTNVVIFADDVTEFNGPLLLIPGSHREQVIDVSTNLQFGASTNKENSDWITSLTANLKYSLDRETVSRLVQEHGITAPKGSAGSVLLFHPNVVHGSSPNMSPFDRSLIIVTYNSIWNTPVPMVKRRPEFLASRDFRALSPLANDCF